MRYLEISLDHGTIIVEVDICQKCHYWKANWWQGKLWQHPTSGKVHQVDGYNLNRTSCGVPFPAGTRIADKTMAVNVS